MLFEYSFFMYVFITSAASTCANLLCFVYACKLWKLRDDVDVDTRTDVVRMTRWSWLMAFGSLGEFVGIFITTTYGAVWRSEILAPDELHTILIFIILQSHFCVHLGQVRVWGWPYKRTLEREVKEERSRVFLAFQRYGCIAFHLGISRNCDNLVPDGGNNLIELIGIHTFHSITHLN